MSLVYRIDLEVQEIRGAREWTGLPTLRDCPTVEALDDDDAKHDEGANEFPFGKAINASQCFSVHIS